MKWLALLLALAGCPGTGAETNRRANAVESPALVQLEALPDMRGNALPPRSDAPRTVVMFFASW